MSTLGDMERVRSAIGSGRVQKKALAERAGFHREILRNVGAGWNPRVKTLVRLLRALDELELLQRDNAP
jgi:hypothetical protein